MQSLQVEFISDWHIGDGAGRKGHVDRRVRRDPSTGLPYSPAKTIVGIWRDACESIAAGLDGQPQNSAGRDTADDGTWLNLICHIFGDQPSSVPETVIEGADFSPPRPARLIVQPSVYSDALVRAVQAYPALKEAMIHIKPGVRIDEFGQAMNKHLRFEERVACGSLLTSPVALNTEGLEADAIKAMQALLWAGAATVERLGGKRRRGSGRCKWNLSSGASEHDKDNDYLSRLGKDAPKIGSNSHQVTKGTDQDGSQDIKAVRRWLKIPLQLTLKSAVVIPGRTVGNVVESLDYIPGTQLLGFVVPRLEKLINRSSHTAVASGAVRVLNAYPQIEAIRSTPIPFSLFFEKRNGGLNRASGRVWNRLQEEEPKTSQLKQHRAGYVGTLPGVSTLPEYHKPNLQITTHGTIDDYVQRPTERVGGVFSYQGISAVHFDKTRKETTPVVYRTEIWIAADLLKNPAPEVAKQFSGKARIGIAKKDDYGRILIAAENGEFRDSVADNEGSPSLTEFTLSCVSDVLLRSPALDSNSSLATLLELLGTELGCPISVSEDLLSQAPERPLSHALRTRRTEGWIAGWHLPRPSFAGISAGSCLKLKADKAVPVASLTALCHRGIGERTAEGFGEIRINDPLVTDFNLSSREPYTPEVSVNAPPSHPTPPPIEASDPDFAFAGQLEETHWKRAIQRRAEQLADETGKNSIRRSKLGWTSNSPPNSQLGGLRSVVMSKGATDGFELAKRWLTQLSATKNRKEKWPEESLGQLATLFESPNAVWNKDWIDSAELTDLATITASKVGSSRTDELKTSLVNFAVRVLILSLIRAEQRAREHDRRSDK